VTAITISNDPALTSLRESCLAMQSSGLEPDLLPALDIYLAPYVSLL
jgi:hypothetical protein